MNRPCNNPIILKLAQMLGQHALRDVGHQAAKLVEATLIAPQVIQDQRFPAAADNPQRALNRTIGRVETSFGHGCGTFSDTTAQTRAYF